MPSKSDTDTTEDATPRPSLRFATPHPIVAFACAVARDLNIAQNTKAGDYFGAYPPTTDERAEILAAFEAALYSDVRGGS